MSQTVVLKVAMSCQGCVGAVNRVLGKMEGVESFNIDKDEQKVTVIGNVQPDAVLQTVAKTGKKTSFWKEPAAPADSESKAAEAETKPEETETKPTEADTKPTETETKPADAETKPAEEVAAA